MKPKDLLSVWSAPDNSRVTNKQFSFRLPVHVAARVAALCEMYPNKSRTQIVSDLLSSALDEMQQQFPDVKGPFVGRDPETGVDLFEDIGPARRFRGLANKHYAELERELGAENPTRLFEGDLVISEPSEK